MSEHDEPGLLHPEYFWARLADAVIEPLTWTMVPFNWIVMNHTNAYIDHGVLIFPARPQGWFGEMSVQIGWNDGPIKTAKEIIPPPTRPYRRSLRMMSQMPDRGEPPYNAAQSDSIYVPYGSDALSGDEAICTQPIAYLQPGFHPSSDGFLWIEVWHNNTEPVHVSGFKEPTNVFGLPLVMYTSSSRFNNIPPPPPPPAE